MHTSSHRYEPFAGDRTGTDASQTHDLLEPPKSPVDELGMDPTAGQAIEITEMANGETIWYAASVGS